MHSDQQWKQLFLRLPGDYEFDSPVLLADGYYYATGVTVDKIAVAKYDGHGDLVTEFGKDGIAELSWPNEAGSWPDIALIGSHLYGGAALRDSTSFFLYRLDSTTGVLDTSFGDGGTRLIPYPEEPQTHLADKTQTESFQNGLQGRAPQIPDRKFRQAVNSGLAQFDENGELDVSFNEVGMRRFFIRDGRLHFTLDLAWRHKEGEHDGFYYGGMYRYLTNDVQAWVGAIDKQGNVVADFADNGMWINHLLPGESVASHPAIHAILQTQAHLYCGGSAGDDAFVFRLDLNGRLDTTFNGGKVVRLNDSRFERTRTFDFVEDGEGVLVGLKTQTSEVLACSVVRLDAAGHIGREFGRDGYLTAPEDWNVDRLVEMKVGDSRFLEIRAPGYIARYSI